MKTFIQVCALLSALGISYLIGQSEGIKEGKNQVETFEIANRYFEVIGNPKTQDEQCAFDYIVHNDKTECRK